MKKENFKRFRHFISFLIFMFVFGNHQNCQAVIFQNDFQQSSQSFKEFKGKVLDSKTNKPLVYADLNITGTNISTVTNAEGEFLLKVPENLLHKKVIISFLGYKKMRVSLSEFKSDNTKIYLDVVITKLSQVNLSTVKNAKALVQEMLKRKAKNYYNDKAIMTAFYRETIKKRKKNASLSEAVVEVYKQPSTSGKKDAIKLIKARKNTNYSKLDTLALKLLGGPFSTLYSDIIKYPEYIFVDDELSHYSFSYDTTSEINGNEVYVINFEQYPNVITPLYYGKLYIDVQSLALIRAEYKLNVSDKNLTSRMFVRKKPRKVFAYPLQAAYRVDYRNKEGKWHYGYSNIQLIFRVKWKNKLFSSTYSLDSEMVITDWEKNTSGIYKPKESLKPNIILSDAASGFSDPEFWGKYNIIEPEKSIESAIKKISKQLKRK